MEKIHTGVIFFYDHCLKQELANYGPQGAACFVNEVLLKRSPCMCLHIV